MSGREGAASVREATPPTLLHALFATAAREPGRLALVAGDREVTWEALARRVAALAARLQAEGVRPGDRVLISGENSDAIPVAYFGAHAAGAVAVPVAPDTPAVAVARIAEDAEVRVALLDRPQDGAPLSLPCPAHDAREVTTDEAASLALDRWPEPSDVADLLFTTGTTGRKKGVVLTHANVRSAAVNISAFVGNAPDDIETVALPLSHSFGLGRLRCAALVGNALVLERGMANSPLVLRRMLQRRATGLALVPAGFDILRRVTGDALGRLAGSLRYVEIGSAPMRAETREWLVRLLPHTRLCHHYGLTEASRAAFTEYHADAARAGSVGRASPHVTITIRDAEGRELAPGDEGEIVVAGGMVLREYWRQPELTARALGPWGFRTGDVGRLDAEGYLYLLGRREDLINVGGRKVVPDEVEEALRAYPGVRDAACVPAPDPEGVLGQQVRAYVVADAPPDVPLDVPALQAWLRERLEDYKVPREVVLVDAIPRTASGKLQRQLLGQNAPG